MRVPRVTLDVIELALIGAGLAVVCFLLGDNRAQARLAPYLSVDAASELAFLQQQYGPSRSSEHGEEWIAGVRAVFGLMCLTCLSKCAGCVVVNGCAV